MIVASQGCGETFRIILVRRYGGQILILSKRGRVGLPTVTVPAQARLAQHITPALNALLRCPTYCLFPIAHAALVTASHSYHVATTAHENSEVHNDFVWAPAESMLATTLENTEDRIAIRFALEHIGGSVRIEASGFFAQPGWLQEVLQWSQTALSRWGLKMNSHFRQYTATQHFSLIRFETDGPAVWFKAVGPPNLREFGITLALAGLFPTYLPSIVAQEPHWNGWLSFEVDGCCLAKYSTLAQWYRVSRSLAALQIRSTDKTPEILAAGARDLRYPRLLCSVGPFIDLMTDLMARQSTATPPALNKQELQALKKALCDVLQHHIATHILSSLNHLDLNAGNILVSETGCVFLDWTESAVSHPFLSLAYLVEHFRRSFGRDRHQEAMVVASYVDRWRAFMPSDAISAGLRAAPLLAVFAQAVAGEPWTDQDLNNDLQRQGYLRSLTRRMKREAESRAVGRAKWVA